MPHRPTHILIVDDIVENLDALEALLTRDGLIISRAQSGSEALELMLVEDFALALLDVQMPGMDGFELAELMRGTERTRTIPIIFLTAVATDEIRRFRGYQAGAFDYLLKPIDSAVLRSKVEVFVELHRQSREIAWQRDQLAAALGRVRAHRDNSPLAIVELDADLKILDWSMGAERMFGRSGQEMVEDSARTSEWLDAESASLIETLVHAMETGQKDRDVLELTLVGAERMRIDVECYCSALRDGFGRFVSTNIQMQDVTERKRAEETQHLLIGELNHRVKNTLASVQAIASQTLRHSAGPSEFAPTFIGRIHALSAAHSLLSDATWRGASLRELIQSQLDIGMLGSERLAAYGPDLELMPELALHLSLVFHELATNAAKYGALSSPNGRVELNWSVVDGMIRFEWVESGGPPVETPRRRGFGSQLIERSVGSEGGKATATYAREGMRWNLALPVRNNMRKREGLSAPAIKQATPPVSAQPDPDMLVGKRAFVIEDEPLVAMNIADMLEQAGVEVLAQIPTRRRALDALQNRTPDFVLLDGNLQGETVEDIAQCLVEREIPFVMVSGYSHSHLPPNLGNVPIVLKPFNNEELMAVLRQTLGLLDCSRSGN